MNQQVGTSFFESLKIVKSGILNGEGNELFSKWELLLKVKGEAHMQWGWRVATEIVEFIYDPSSIGALDEDLRIIYNPEMEKWISRDEAEKLKRRIPVILDLDEVQPLFGFAPEKSKREWSFQEAQAIAEIPDSHLEQGLELIRKKITFKKFGL